MPSHTVKQGEHLSRLAHQYGFRDYRTIWQAGGNAELRKKRPNPHVLLPGDIVEIPEKQEKLETGPTGQLHRFEVPAQILELHLQVETLYGKPLASTTCELRLDGSVRTVTTDAQGHVEQDIRRPAEEGSLEVVDEGSPYKDLEIALKIGHLDPVEELTGQQARLNNLGYRAGAVGGDDPEALRSATEEFQCDNGLTVDGVCGPKTQAQLLKLHGC
jgi:N-acetylmuramoyl-L-alanine amidase